MRSHRDHHFAASVPLAEISERLGKLAQRIPPVDHWCDLLGLKEVFENDPVVWISCREHRDHSLSGSIQITESSGKPSE